MKLYERCIRCGRKLKNEESKELGFGKVCWEKWNAEINAKPLFDTGVMKGGYEVSGPNKEQEEGNSH